MTPSLPANGSLLKKFFSFNWRGRKPGAITSKIRLSKLSPMTLNWPLSKAVFLLRRPLPRNALSQIFLPILVKIGRCCVCWKAMSAAAKLLSPPPPPTRLWSLVPQSLRLMESFRAGKILEIYKSPIWHRRKF